MLTFHACTHERERPDYRLPRTVIPTAYDIEVEADPHRDTFPGHVHIEAQNLVASADIELHTQMLEIEKATAQAGGVEYQAEVTHDEKTQRTRLHFDQPLPAGPIALDIDYQGHVRNDMHGVYLGDDGDQEAIVTQCEAAAARSIFPCFDEPEFKASLEWTIVADPNYTVVANGPETETVLRPDGKLEHHFAATTKPLPTYLAAFTVGEYEATEPEIVAGIPTRVIVGKGKLEQAKFAQEVTRNVLPALSEYFDQPYPFAKLDQVAVPGFDAGAMENVGAIFYRQSLLQMDAETTPLATKKAIAEVIAHENCHQWFGNLVSPDWWDDLWLNEAFATWHSKKLIDEWQPEWRIWDDFVVGDRAAGMQADALASTHPIYGEVKDPHEATQNFDVITYRKGASILRMVEQYVGADRFRDGLRAYMRDHAEGNARSSDLWKALDEAAPGTRVSEMMQNWVGQAGFPVLETSLEGNRLEVSQHRFRADGSEPGDQTWLVPMVIRYRDEEGVKTHRALLDGCSGSVELPSVGEVQWAYPNAGVSGFYRTSMAAAQLEQVLAGLDSLAPAEKVNLLDDQWEMVRTGEADLEGFMKALKACASDSDPLVAGAVAGHLRSLDRELVDSSSREAFTGFTSELMRPHLERLSSSSLSDEEQELKAQVLQVLSEDPEVVAESQRLAALEARDPGAVDPNVAPVVLGTAASAGDAETLERFTAVYAQRREEKSSPSAQLRYLSAMTRFRDPEAVDSVVRMAAGEPGQPVTFPQDQMVRMFAGLLTNPEAREQTWEYLRENWEAVRARAGEMSISRLVEALGALPGSQASEVEEFFQEHPVPEAARSVSKAVEEMKLRADLVARVGPQLSAWLGG